MWGEGKGGAKDEGPDPLPYLWINPLKLVLILLDRVDFCLEPFIIGPPPAVLILASEHLCQFLRK